MINILFTCIGKRVELIQTFIAARDEKCIKGNIICADSSNSAPAMYFGNKMYFVPPVNSNEYIESLIEICRIEKISLIIPTIDLDLSVLSENKEKFTSIGTQLLLSSKEVINITGNKMSTYNFFKSIGIKTPQSYDNKLTYSGEIPCFIKPICGFGSINAYKVISNESLLFYKKLIGDYIIQQFIDGDEFTIDVFCDFHCKVIYCTSRKRLFVRGGEVTKTRIIHDEILTEQILKIIEILKPVGPITVQAIKSKADNQYYFIEINPRFGSGAPLTMKAGANSASAVYELLLNKSPMVNYHIAKENLILRYEQSIMLNEQGDYIHETI